MSLLPLEIFTPRDPAEIEPFRRIVSQALLVPLGRGNRPEPPAPAGDWLAREGHENLRLGRLDGRIVGGLSVQRMGQWFGGRSVPTGGVRAVAVAPEVRSRGVTRTLLLAALEEMRRDGVCLSTLYPATQVVYRRAGFELAGSRLDYRLPLAGLRFPAAPGVELAEASLDTPEPFAAAYRQRAETSNGPLDRSPWAWTRLLDPVAIDNPSYAYLARRDGAVEGYVVYSQARLPGTVRGELLARDFVALTPDALAALLRLLSEHRSMFDSVAWSGAPAEALFCRLENPTLRLDRRWDWMLRLVDVARALAARGYPAAVSGRVELEVRDDFLGWNQGRVVLEVSGGKAEVRRGGEGRVKADVRGLAALYSSYLTPWELGSAGYLEGPPGDLATLAAIFAGPAPWMPDFF